MIFVDTSAWFALFVDSDAKNQLAREWIRENQDAALVTTDYVVDELLTLMIARGGHHKATHAGQRILFGRTAELEFIARTDFELAWETFQKYSDKRWSFTDCTSRVVMERLGITTAFAFDDHFHQFANVTVVP